MSFDGIDLNAMNQVIAAPADQPVSQIGGGDSDYINVLPEGIYTATLWSAGTYLSKAKQNPMMRLTFVIENGGPVDMDADTADELAATVYGKMFTQHQMIRNMSQTDPGKLAFVFFKVQELLASTQVLGSLEEIRNEVKSLADVANAVDELDGINKQTEGGLQYSISCTHRNNPRDPANPFISVTILDLLTN